MSSYSDDQLAQVRAQSDRAFMEMQARADREMASFLQQYGKAVSLQASAPPQPQPGSKRPLRHKLQRPVGPPPQQTPVPQQAPTPQQAPAPQQAPTTQNPNLSPPVDDPSVLFEGPGVDLGSFSKENVKESRKAAQDAVKGTSDILKNSAFDLGKRAKEEATALKEAAKRALEEERSLKSMKGRAAEEAQKAKARLQQQAAEAKNDMMDNLQDLAKDKLDNLMGKANDAFEAGQASLNREWDELTGGE